MRLDRTRCLITVVILAATGCAPRQAEVPISATSSQEVVEISNRASFPVMVKYYTEGGGPHGLGIVRPYRREVLILPREDAGHILVETADGERIGRGANLIGIRRYRIHPQTGERIGPVTVIRQ